MSTTEISPGGANEASEKTFSPTPEEPQAIEVTRTITHSLGHSNYYEQNGLRIEGDGADHSRYNPRSLRFIMTVIGCSFALAGSQIVPLLYFSLGNTIANALNALDIAVWLVTAFVIAMGALAPFVGPLADLFGRKPLFLVGLTSSTIGGILCASTPNVAGFIAGQVFLGCGAVIQELLSISIVAESVPTAKRSLYAALILITILPWSPGTLYGNLIVEASWRWIGCTLAIWNVITLAIIAYFYRPPPRVNSLGLSRKEMIARIDFLGGGLVIGGMIFFLVGLNWGGQQYGWSSAHVRSFLLVGAVLLIAFGFWEKFGAPYPLFPRRIVHAPRPFFCLLFVIFAAGINFVAIVVFWPIQSTSVYGTNHFRTGINSLPIGICIIGGGILSAVLLGLFKNHVTFIMTFFCVMQTVAAACLIVADPHNIRTAFAPIILSLIGTGGVLLPNQLIVTVITPDDLLASVTALTVGLRAQAQVLGLSIFYNRFVHEVTKRAFKTIIPALLSAGVFSPDVISSFILSLTAVPYDSLAKEIPQLVGNRTDFELVREASVQCFEGALKLVYWITVPFGVAACLAAAGMGDVSGFMDEHVAVVL